MAQKEYNLYIIRLHHQARAKQEMLSSESYVNQMEKDFDVCNNRKCPDSTKSKELFDVEKFEIRLDVLDPNLLDLYAKIKEVCPEFSNKRKFHLYWKNSRSNILPISNYITYLSMMSLMAHQNRYLYLVDREWNETWLRNTASIYTAIPEDRVLVNMIAPQLSAYTQLQEDQLGIVKSAGTIEFTKTYSPPAARPKKLTREDNEDKDTPMRKGKNKSPQTIKSSKLKSKK